MTAAPGDLRCYDRSGIAELASESIIIFDPDRRVRYWNPAAERLFGWPFRAMLGSEITDLSLSPAEVQSARG